MTDQPERKNETEEAAADFEGHRLQGPDFKQGIGDVKQATDDDADFEGHRLMGPDVKQGIGDVKQ